MSEFKDNDYFYASQTNQPATQTHYQVDKDAETRLVEAKTMLLKANAEIIAAKTNRLAVKTEYKTRKRDQKIRLLQVKHMEKRADSYDKQRRRFERVVTNEATDSQLAAELNKVREEQNDLLKHIRDALNSDAQ